MIEIEPIQFDEESAVRARAFIEAVRWQVAKTYEKTAPHEYTVRKWCPDLEKEYAWFDMLIRDAGVKKKFWKTQYSYLYLDGYRYWTGWPPILINRCPADQPWQ
jgi:hypothetical protein